MNLINNVIEVVCWMDRSGKIHPTRFRITDKDGLNSVIKIDKVITVILEKLAGNPMYVYNCSSMIDGVERLYTIKYEMHTCKWILFKM